MTLVELFTDTANAIREKDGTTDKITAENFPNRIRNISSGDSSECNAIIKNSTATSFNIKTWLVEISNWDLSNVTASCASLFSSYSSLIKVSNLLLSKATVMNGLFSSCKKLTNVTNLVVPSATNLNQMFYSCSKLEKVEELDNSAAQQMYQMFYSCGNLKYLSELQASFATNVGGMFSGCDALEEFGGLKNLGQAYTEQTANYSNYKLDLSECINLTHDSLINVINGLYDLNLTYDVANGGTLYRQSLVLGATNLAKLTEEEIAIATNKGWDVT